MRWFLFLSTLLASVLICGAALAEDKVVHDIDDAATQATKALRNVRNHLDVGRRTPGSSS